MKTLYFECRMGAAGDMLTGALIDMLPDGERVEAVSALNSLGIDGVKFAVETAEKAGIHGTSVRVLIDGAEEADWMPAHVHHHHDHGHDHDVCHEGQEHHHHDHGHGYDVCHEEQEHHHHDHGHGHDVCHEGQEHHHCVHRGMSEIEAILCGLSANENVKNDALAVYRLIAEAESKAHQRPVSQVHFHEVGALDAIADIAAVCFLIDRMKPDEIVVSPVHVGSGVVRCAHGILPVPAPATAEILRGVPTYGGRIAAELCTPTGAALLKYFAARFGPQPLMTVGAIGYGMGKKDFEAANCVRAFWGESAS